MYLALYRKYRPKTFDDVVSQEHITKTLRNQISGGKTAHAYLFTGSRGTGKTTCAKIFAKAVNCQNPKNGEPCLECDACRGIEDGSVTDVVEIDAASNNGVENIRELRETAFFTPTFAKYRVYIIDEVHMLSVAAFNALLKIMEEPPSHVKFILATTEVHKVPITVISRCQRFDFKRIKDEDIAKRLKFIAEKENVKLTDDASSLIARLADGAMRDGISLLDRILASSDEVTLEAVENSVGVASTDYIFELCDCIAENDSAAALAMINELYMGSKDLQRLCSELINHFRNLMLIKAIGDCGDLVKATGKELERLNEQQNKFTMGQIISCATKLQECSDKIGKTSGKRIELEMCMIKLCTAKAEKTETVKTVKVQSETPVTSMDDIPKLPRDNPIIPKLPKEEVKVEEKVEVKVEPAPIVETVPEPIPEPIPIPETESDAVEEVTPEPIKEEKVEVKSEQASDEFEKVPQWPQILDELVILAPHLAAIKDDAKAVTRSDNFYVGVSSPFLLEQLKRDGNTAYIRQAIMNVLGRDYALKLKLNSDNKPKEKKPIDTLLENAKALGIEIEE